MGGPGSGRKYELPRLNLIRRTTDGRTVEEKMQDFLEAFVEYGVINVACIKAKISRDVFYDWKNNVTEFATAFAYAVEEVSDQLEGEAIRRAVKGNIRPIYNKEGVQVGEIKEYSDQLLMFLLKGWKHEKYGNQLNINKNINNNSTVLLMPSNGRELKEPEPEVEYIPEINISEVQTEQNDNQQGDNSRENVL